MDKSLCIIKEVIGGKYFPDYESLSSEIIDNLREITVTSGNPVVYWVGNEMYFKDRYKGNLTKNSMDAAKVTDEYIEDVLNNITECSPYVYERSMAEGYIPYKNGIRVSVFGDGYLNTDGESLFRKINTISFRISRIISGVSKKCIDYITDGVTVFNTLIVSPPGCGKTTLLRDIASELSKKFRTGIADERGEICVGDMGLCSMIVRGIPKRKAFDIFIRNASADVIICDEVGGKDDTNLLFESQKRGVKVIATIHGETISDVKTNPLSKDICAMFDTIILLGSDKGKGEINEVYFMGEKR